MKKAERRVSQPDEFNMGTPEDNKGKSEDRDEQMHNEPNGKPINERISWCENRGAQSSHGVEGHNQDASKKRRADVGMERLDTRPSGYITLPQEYHDNNDEGIMEDDEHLQNVDVAEAYSPARVVPAAAEQGLNVGEGISMVLADGLDFSQASMRRKAETLIIEKAPLVLIISVMCRDRRILMNLNWNKLGRNERERRMANARMHLSLVCKLALVQHRAGRDVVHEHPALARSWLGTEIVDLQRRTGAKKLLVDQCMYGQMCRDDTGVVRPVRKPTICMTKSPAMERFLNKICSMDHKHIQWVGKWRAEAAHVYPKKLVDALVQELSSKNSGMQPTASKLVSFTVLKRSRRLLAQFHLKKTSSTCQSQVAKHGTTSQAYPSTQGELLKLDEKKFATIGKCKFMIRCH